MNQRALSRGSWSRPYCTFHANSVLLLRRAQLARHSKAQKASPSPHAEGGEGWGEEGYSSWGRPVRQQLDAPLPSPLPARSSRGEGVGAVAYPAASSVRPPYRHRHWSAPPPWVFAIASTLMFAAKTVQEGTVENELNGIAKRILQNAGVGIPEWLAAAAPQRFDRLRRW